MGIEHMEVDPVFARRSLESEMAEMGEEPLDPLMDPISEDGSVVRINLRPYKTSGGDMDKLLEAYIHSSKDFHGDTRKLEMNWERAVKLQPFPAVAMNMLMNTMREHNYPAVHHSDAYKKTYKPAYRVVWREYINFPEQGD